MELCSFYKVNATSKTTFRRLDQESGDAEPGFYSIGRLPYHSCMKSW